MDPSDGCNEKGLAVNKEGRGRKQLGSNGKGA